MKWLQKNKKNVEGKILLSKTEKQIQYAFVD
jgi:hypothetical protein